MPTTKPLLALLVLLSINCSTDQGDDFGGDSADEAGIEVAGYWTSNFGESEIIDATSWNDAVVVSFDNEDNYAILQNRSDAEFFPGKFSKVVWTESEYDSFYYCTVDFGRETREAAERSEKRADASDPEKGGCGEFAWTKLSRE